MMGKLTKFSKLVFILWNILIYHVYASPNVYQMNNAITWSQANKMCDVKGLEDSDKKLKDSDIPVEYEFWIGKAVYRELTPWIEVLGCTSTTDNDIKVYTVESIGLCQMKCYLEKVFGYRNKALHRNCACFIKGVPKLLNIACDISSYFLVHKNYNSKITDDLIDPGNCATLCCGSCMRLQRDILMGRNCNATDSSIVGRCNPFIERYAKWGLNYYNSRDYCWQNNRLLLPPSFCEESSFKRGTRAWTNIFRESVEVVKRGSHQNPILCYTGVLHQRGNSTKDIVIYRNKCNADVRWYICKNISNAVQHHTTAFSLQVTSFNQNPIVEERSTSGVEELQTRKLSTSNSLKVSTFQQSLSTNVVQHHTTAFALHTTSFDRKPNIEAKSTSVGIIIGGAIGAFVLLLISAAIFVCRKRSIGIFKGKKKTNEDKVEFSKRPKYDLHCKNASHVEPISNQNYGIATNQSNTYAVVDKLKKSDQKFTNDDETYTDSSDGQYDQLNDIQKRKIVLGGNLYDSHEGMRDQNDPTYDISEFSRSHEVTDVYDHSFVGVQNDGEYDYSSTYRSDLTNEIEMYDKTV